MTEPVKPNGLARAAWWIAWGVFSVTGLFVLLRIRALLLYVSVLLGAEGYTVGTVDKFGLIVLAILWIIFVAMLEGYLHAAVDKGKLGARCLRILLAQGAIIALSYSLM